MKTERIGLIGAGKFADASVFRALSLSGRLGPVRAPSVRVGSRIANTLRAGHAVRGYEEFAACSLILISVPDSKLPGVVAELAGQPFGWERKSVLVCSGQRDSSVLEPLARRGADVGSVCAIPGFEHHWILVEGTAAVESAIQHLIDPGSTRLTVIQPATKRLYLSALACTNSLFLPMLDRASRALEQAGVSAAHACTILEKQIERSTRSYFRAGRKSLQNSRLDGYLDAMLTEKVATEA